MYTHKKNARLFVILCVFTISFFLLFLRLAYLQIVKHRELTRLALAQHNLTIDLPPQRGNVYDRNKRELAISLRVDSVYAVPKEIKDKKSTARALAKALGRDEKSILKKLDKSRWFVWIERRVPNDKSELIRGLGLKGIGFVKEYKRFYPNGPFCAHLLGYVGVDGAGLEGIELYYDKYLKGKPGLRRMERDARGKALAALESRFVPAKDGLDVITSIDEVIQHLAETELEKAIIRSRARAGSIIVMDPRSGEILALANKPDFDPNFFWNYDDIHRRNRAVCDIFEPGSTFKIVTASAVLNEKLISPATKFFCENGAYYYAGHTLHDHKPHGWLTFREIIELSSNIGTCKVAQVLGKEQLFKYIKLFGFGEKTRVDLPGEARGIAKPPGRWSKVSITNIPMGQEVAVTSLQLAAAMSAIANGGTLVAPKVVRKIIDNDGQVIYESKPMRVRKVLSQEASAQMRGFLKGVVESGTAKLARVDGYAAGGKTGTAQKIEPNGGYSHSRFVASFFGFAPVERPAVVIGIVLDEPHPYYFGGVVAAPVFGKVAADVLRYLGISDET